VLASERRVARSAWCISGVEQPDGMLEVDGDLQCGIRLCSVHNTHMPGRRFWILVPEHVLDRAQIVCVAIRQRGAGVAQRVVRYPWPFDARQRGCRRRPTSGSPGLSPGSCPLLWIAVS
jgi:hypothetical protein